MFTAEHLELQKTHPSLAHDYTNIVYACRFCNRARGVRPRTSKDRHILDPTQDAWANHFYLEEDFLVPKAGDVNASYTHEAYDINDDRKSALREKRSKTLTACIPLIQNGPSCLQELLDMEEIALAKENIDDSLALRRNITELERGIHQAISNLNSYTAIPADAPNQCRCGTTEMHRLPEEFARQTQQIQIS